MKSCGGDCHAESLIGIAKSIERNKKGEKLRELLRGLITGKGKKVVIFTQFRTTQDYLCGLLSDYSVVPFNGSMDRDRKEEAIQSFRDGADVLISTVAGGEGRNMQFCNILINYDLPWSPLKVEQRIGRVHRFGQPYDVYIYNFATRDTVAERVLEVLTRKLKLFEESIGVPDVLLGQMEDELNLTALFMEAAAGGKSKKAMMAEVDEKIKNARRSYEKLSELTVARNMDFNYDEYYAITMKERQFSNRRIESFVNRLGDADQETAKLIGPKNRRNGLYAVKGLSGDGVRRFGTFDSRIALDNESLEFLAFGHPLVRPPVLPVRVGELWRRDGNTDNPASYGVYRNAVQLSCYLRGVERDSGVAAGCRRYRRDGRRSGTRRDRARNHLPGGA